MTKLYTISEISKMTKLVRASVSKYIRKNLNTVFIPVVLKNQVKYQTNLNDTELVDFLKKAKKNSFKNNGKYKRKHLKIKKK